MAERPIGIFDSGIGGLTVAHAITQQLPNERIVYFGDTAHLPYGDKSAESIKQYSTKITEFLLEQNCKKIVIACNTASSYAFKEVQQIAKNIEVTNVIDPVVEYIVNKHTSNNIGVIGTKGTIGSKVYPNRIHKLDATIKVSDLATPLLAPMIEEGFIHNKISHDIIESYLSKPQLANIDSIILACTHYPLIKDEISAYYNSKVEILDSAEIVAKHITSRLTSSELVKTKLDAKHQFFVSDYTESFEKSAKHFFHEQVELKEVRLFG